MNDQGLRVGAHERVLWVAITVTAPVLGLSMFVGLLISILQVVTQVQEMSLTFIPKLLAVAIGLIAFGPWMLSTVLRFAFGLFENIPMSS